MLKKYYFFPIAFILACGGTAETKKEDITQKELSQDTNTTVEIKEDTLTDKRVSIDIHTESKKPIQVKIDSTPKVKKEKEVKIETNKLSLEENLTEMGLVNIQNLDPTIKIDVKYSTTDNFMKVDAYQDFDKIFLQKEVAEMLVKAHTNLKKNYPNYRFLIFDGARPFQVQQRMWQIVKGTDKAHYVARPDAKGSMHNYGCAVDLTISDDKGKQLDMGTPFDYFGVLAHTDKDAAFMKEGKLTKQQVENRNILKKAMESVGFKVLKREWWHFNAFPDDIVLKRYKKIP